MDAYDHVTKGLAELIALHLLPSNGGISVDGCRVERGKDHRGCPRLILHVEDEREPIEIIPMRTKVLINGNEMPQQTIVAKLMELFVLTPSYFPPDGMPK